MPKVACTISKVAECRQGDVHITYRRIGFKKSGGLRITYAEETSVEGSHGQTKHFLIAVREGHRHPKGGVPHRRAISIAMGVVGINPLQTSPELTELFDRLLVARHTSKRKKRIRTAPPQLPTNLLPEAPVKVSEKKGTLSLCQTNSLGEGKVSETDPTSKILFCCFLLMLAKNRPVPHSRRKTFDRDPLLI